MPNYIQWRLRIRMFDDLVSLRKFFEVYADMPVLDEIQDRVVVNGQFTQAAEAQEAIILWVTSDRVARNAFVDDVRLPWASNLSPLNFVSMHRGLVSSNDDGTITTGSVTSDGWEIPSDLDFSDSEYDVVDVLEELD